MVILFIVTATIFNFLYGFHDFSNFVASVISSNALRPRNALVLTTISEFIAPFAFGVAVATTVGSGLIDPSALSRGDWWRRPGYILHPALGDCL
jgi:PiT family inorganic phosphate transporter